MHTPGRYEFVQRQLDHTLQTLERRLRRLQSHHIAPPHAVAFLDGPSLRDPEQILHRLDLVEAQLQELAQSEPA